ncbi:MAG: phospho-N-acetylmuramoyl-pentapeptide-transferase [Candidatus Omnitrophica bacterium]|nr:phospho-N-acetylmuramoyl-pentapeptide-transferase [Candidatus Omnitrophota bacterium]
MFYFLSQFKDQFSELNIFRYITFRSAGAAITTFLLSVFIGPIVIAYLRKIKVQEVAKRHDCPDLDKFTHSKQGTPTMGGTFIIGSIIISVLLWADLSNRYIILTLLTSIWLAILGFFDDYFKLKGIGKRGLTKKTKLVWQVMLGCFIGSYVYFNPDSTTKLDVPFLKDVFLDLGLFYIPFAALIVIGTSNAVNLTDGLDGLAIGCVLIVSIALSVLCYITGNANFAEYLFLPFVKGGGELTVFCAAMLGASLGFLWFNCYPANIFMGDTGSLSLGGTLGVIAIFIKKELLLVIIGGVFVMEAVSVILQVASFKLWGKRIFKISPLHHHFQMSNWSESKIIIRFWIIGIILALVALATLKIR